MREWGWFNDSFHICVSAVTLQRILSRYDAQECEDGCLTLEEFVKMVRRFRLQQRSLRWDLMSCSIVICCNWSRRSIIRNVPWWYGGRFLLVVVAWKMKRLTVSMEISKFWWLSSIGIFDFSQKLGAGSFGEVHLVTEKAWDYELLVPMVMFAVQGKNVSLKSSISNKQLFPLIK